ncbi:MAG: AsmA family protein [Alphaproteobacteria bacterium]|nr:AsmA family protein [Alphaproteobacteria bacterium]
MPSPLLRRSIWALGLAVLLVVAAAVALPYFASTRIVRDRIAKEIGDWSGLVVSIGGNPQFTVWPRFQAVLTDVSMTRPDEPGEPVLATERMEISLSAFAALAGNVEFSTARLVRPTLRVALAPNGLPVAALPRSGRIGQSLAIARGIVAEDRLAPNTARLPDDRFGTVAFTDGRIVSGTGSAVTELVSGLAGNLQWERLDGQAKLAATGVWRGEAFSLDAAAAGPLLMLGGGESPLTIAFKSAPTTLSFEGKASLSENAYFDGRASFTTPSMLRMIEWTNADILHGTEIGAVSIRSNVSGDAQRIRFEEAVIALDGNPGTGTLDLLLTGELPVVAGTLAFDAIDLKSFLSAFTPLEHAAGSGPGDVDRDFASRLNLDLRLSARQATAGSLTLADVAATARVNDGFAAFDISDASAFGGNVQTGLRFDRKPEGTQIELRLLASEIDGGAFGAAAGITRLVPVGRGTVSVILKGQGTTWEEIMEHANGSVAASFGAGALAGLDMDRFVTLLGEGQSFPLEEVAKGSFPIEAMEVKASVADGVASIETAKARSAARQVTLSGTVPYRGGSLALSGSVGPAAGPAGEEAAKPLPFHVGGAWNNPFIAPTAEALSAE